MKRRQDAGYVRVAIRDQNYWRLTESQGVPDAGSLLTLSVELSSFFLLIICFKTGDTFVTFLNFLLDLERTVRRWDPSGGTYLGLNIVLEECFGASKWGKFSRLFLISALRAMNAFVSCHIVNKVSLVAERVSDDLPLCTCWSHLQRLDLSSWLCSVVCPSLLRDWTLPSLILSSGTVVVSSPLAD